MQKLKRLRRPALCLCLSGCLLLGGCMSNLTERPLSESAPAQISVGYTAPQEDFIAPRTLSAVLYFLNYDGTQLLSEVRDVTVEEGRSLEQTVLEALFAGPQSASLRAIGDVGLSQECAPVEVCGGVATVNLDARARLLSPQELFTVRMAIAGTLGELSNIDYVNVLVEGREEGHDLAALMPVGAIEKPGSLDLSSQWARLETQRAAEGDQVITRQATLYFPIASGPYVMPEVRTVTLSSANLLDYTLTLLDELGRGAATLSDARPVPPPNEYLSALPDIVLMDGTAEKVIRLHFTSALYSALYDTGVTASLYWSMLVHTLTTFIPGIDGVVIRVNGELIEYISAQETEDLHVVAFANGQMRRADFAGTLASYADLYFPSVHSDHLVRVRRAMRQQPNIEPRALVRELLEGPNEDEGDFAAQVFPTQITDEDFIALAIEGEALLIHVSENFKNACAPLTRVEERNLVYALVNTMTEIEPVRRVYFFVDGQQVDTLSGTLEMRGAFWSNPGIVEQFD